VKNASCVASMSNRSAASSPATPSDVVDLPHHASDHRSRGSSLTYDKEAFRARAVWWSKQRI